MSTETATKDPDVPSARKIATAADLKSKPILVDVPGTDLQLKCRRPDPLDLIASNLLPLDLYADVLAQLGKGQFVEPALKEPALYGDFVDRWVCAAVVEPRIVYTRDESLDQADAIWVEDLEPEIRFAVWRRTQDRLVSRRVSEAVQEFREQCTLRDRARSSSAAVSPAPEPVAVAG